MIRRSCSRFRRRIVYRFSLLMYARAWSRPHTPAGEGSPAGLHTHRVDQVFYVLSGTMSLEIEGTEYKAGPGTLVFFPAGVPHRNWNAGSEPTVHLAINVPQPDPSVPFATTVNT